MPAIAALIIDFIKKEDSKSEPDLYQHYTWQINTFWGIIILSILGVVTIFIGVGIFILIGVFIWSIYRVIKGWIYLAEEKSLYSNNKSYTKTEPVESYQAVKPETTKSTEYQQLNQGKIIFYNGNTGEGLISCDGQQYEFNIKQWRSDSAPSLNQTVKFEICGTNILFVKHVIMN